MIGLLVLSSSHYWLDLFYNLPIIDWTCRYYNLLRRVSRFYQVQWLRYGGPQFPCVEILCESISMLMEQFGLNFASSSRSRITHFFVTPCIYYILQGPWGGWGGWRGGKKFHKFLSTSNVECAAVCFSRWKYLWVVRSYSYYQYINLIYNFAATSPNAAGYLFFFRFF